MTVTPSAFGPSAFGDAELAFFSTVITASHGRFYVEDSPNFPSWVELYDAFKQAASAVTALAEVIERPVSDEITAYPKDAEKAGGTLEAALANRNFWALQLYSDGLLAALQIAPYTDPQNEEAEYENEVYAKVSDILRPFLPERTQSLLKRAPSPPL